MSWGAEGGAGVIGENESAQEPEELDVAMVPDQVLKTGVMSPS